MKMNNDGWGQMGAGPSDNRIAGDDLQHSRQLAGQGGPMKEALDSELARHKESRDMRLKHLEDHYKR
jgi:hypothetical protein